MLKHSLASVALALSMLPLAVAAGGSEPPAPLVWSSDAEAVKAQAEQEGKAILADFTGSDWCRYCILLRSEILDTPEFAAYAEGKFVPLEVDVPKKEIPAGLSIQNTQLCKQYQVKSFPTVLILSPQGDVLGGFIGGVGSFDDIHDTLDAGYANLAKLKAARATTGPERAKLLAEVYTTLPGDIKPKAEAYKQEIAEHDPVDLGGLGDEAKAAEQMKAFREELRTTGADFKAAVAMVDRQLETAYPANKAELLLLKSQAMTYGAETKEDIQQAKDILLQAISLQPDPKLAHYLRENFLPRYNEPEELLKEVTARRK